MKSVAPTTIKNNSKMNSDMRSVPDPKMQLQQGKQSNRHELTNDFCLMYFPGVESKALSTLATIVASVDRA